MAQQLVSAMTGEFDPAQYKDEYREALETIIQAKVEGHETVAVEAPEESGKLIDLMAALEASVNAAKAARDSSPTSPCRVADAKKARAARPSKRRRPPTAAKARGRGRRGRRRGRRPAEAEAQDRLTAASRADGAASTRRDAARGIPPQARLREDTRAGPGRRRRPAATGRFVVQRHRATRLHYDFRLEIEGVLVSWAVPKGPTLDPAVRRMAVHVEDHPIEYFDFEGVIPAKQYGAGDVIVWDWGTWEPEAPTLDPRTAVADGELKFVLHGQKLKGRFTIVRTSGRRRKGDDPSARAFEDDDGEQWLLIHKARRRRGRGLGRRGPPAERQDRPHQRRRQGRPRRDLERRGARRRGRDRPDRRRRRRRCRSSIEPMLATLASKPFSDPDWLYEIKWDGFRVQAVVDGGKVRLWTRGLKDAETYFPRLLDAADVDRGASRRSSTARSSPSTRRAGRTSRCSRPSSAQAGAAGLLYQAFDLLYLDGRSLLNVPLEDRKRLLRSVLKDHPRVRLRGPRRGRGQGLLRGGEGSRARGDRSPSFGAAATSRAGARSAWLKLKIRPEQELVVGGWTPGEGNARDLGRAGGRRTTRTGSCGSPARSGRGSPAATRKELLAEMQPLVAGRPAVRPAAAARTTRAAGAAT